MPWRSSACGTSQSGPAGAIGNLGQLGLWGEPLHFTAKIQAVALCSPVSNSLQAHMVGSTVCLKLSSSRSVRRWRGRIPCAAFENPPSAVQSICVAVACDKRLCFGMGAVQSGCRPADQSRATFTDNLLHALHGHHPPGIINRDFML